MTAETVPAAEAATAPKPLRAPRPSRALADTLGGAVAGGRLSADSTHALGYTPALVLAPPDAEGQWRAIDLDLASLDRIPPARIMELLADLAPDFSRALWDFQRFGNPGHDYDILGAAGEPVDDARARAEVERVLDALRARYGSLDVPIGRLYTNALLRGAFFAEGVLDAAGRSMIDIAVPDASSVRFRRERDPERGTVDRLGQMQGGQFVPLDRPTIRYIPVDPFPNSPYGRPPLAAAIFGALFRLGLLRDLRRVVAQQGWPRIDIAIDAEKIREQMAADFAAEGKPFDNDAYFDVIDAVIARVSEQYARLPPDGAYVHTTDATINRPVGAVDSSSLGAVDGLMKAVERALVQALKTMGFLLSLSESATETQANRQFEAFMQTVRTFQHGAETILGDLLTIALRAAGIPGRVRFRFAENRASEEQRDQLVLQLKLQNARTAYDNGLIDQDEQAQLALGKDAAAEKAPRATAKGAAPGANPDEDPQQGGGRAVQASQLFTPEDGEEGEGECAVATSRPSSAPPARDAAGVAGSARDESR